MYPGAGIKAPREAGILQSFCSGQQHFQVGCVKLGTSNLAYTLLVNERLVFFSTRAAHPDAPIDFINTKCPT